MTTRSPYLIPAVYILVSDKNGRFLLLERKNTGYKDGQLTFPSGHVEFGESATVAAIRELWEETGLQVKENDLELVHVMTRKIENGSAYIDIYFSASSSQGVATNREQEKAAQLIWSSPESLSEKVIDHVYQAYLYTKKGIATSYWE